ncbi:hypothetical protein O6H91_18G037200 [Diphasiastrum complanatum]|nr:hypothetical protein O6H91_18G037100 [Diphasiastrum complanatum]KAJ7523096.1 hypothetical protein O6H91_18G037200 [Diphasiastrum complanatum]
MFRSDMQRGVAAGIEYDYRPGKRARLAWDDSEAENAGKRTEVGCTTGNINPYGVFRPWRQRTGWIVINKPERGVDVASPLVTKDYFDQAMPACYAGQSEQSGCLSVAAAKMAVQPGSTISSVPFFDGVLPRAIASSPPWREDDKDGHYMFELGENITYRYKVISKMGEGTFGRVLECWDREAQEFVAIKLIRNVQKYRDAAMIEIDVLRVLAKNDKGGSRRCVQLKDWFDYRNHVCMVFEKLGPSLYDFLRKNSYRPYSVDLVREFGRQLLESVAYMHDLTLIHTDLKPENILLVSSDHVKVLDYKKTSSGKEFKKVPKTCEIKLIDFGSATFDSRYHCSIVSTRHYRAPEVILGLGWSYSCDLWSVGCILVELCSGDTLFQTHENLEHLAMMERVLGPFPQHMIKRAE